MAGVEPDQNPETDLAGQAQDFLGSILGGGANQAGHFDARMGKTFLALVKNNTNEIGSGGEASRAEGAQAAIENWREAAERRLELAGNANPTPQQIQDNMIARMEEDLVRLGRGAPLTDPAKAQISELLSQDNQGFVDAIVENAEELNSTRAAHASKVAEVNAYNKDRPESEHRQMPLYEHIGIMGALMEPTEVTENGVTKVTQESGLGNINVRGVDVTPQGQLSGAMDNAFDSMSRLMDMRNGAEIPLAMIHGAQWGEFKGGLNNDADRLTYAGLNRFQGPGGLMDFPMTPPDNEVSPYKQWVNDFFDNDGLGGTHSVVEGGAEVASSAHGLLTQPLLDQGLLTLDEGLTAEQQQAVLQEWNEGLKDGFLQKLSGDDFKEHMQEVAQGIDGLTLGDGSAPVSAAEVVVHHDGLDEAREIAARQEAAGVEFAHGSDQWRERRVEVYREEATAAAQKAERLEAAGETAEAAIAAEEAQRLDAAAESLLAPQGEDQAQLDNGSDNVVLASANINAPIGGGLDDAALEESQMQMRQFDAAGFEIQRDTFQPDAGTAARLGLNNVDSQMGTVPVVVAGLNQPTQSPMPQMGYGMQAVVDNAPQMDMGLNRA